MNSKKLYLLVIVSCIIAPAMVHASGGYPIYKSSSTLSAPLHDISLSNEARYGYSTQQRDHHNYHIDTKLHNHFANSPEYYHGVATYQSNIVEPFTDGEYGSDKQSVRRHLPPPDDPGDPGSPIGSVLWLLPFAAIYLLQRKKE